METKQRQFNSRPLFYAFLSLLLAISTTRFLFVANWTYLSVVLVVFVLFLGYAIWKKRFVTLIVVVAAFLFGIGWYFVGTTTFQGKLYTEICQVKGRVSEGVSYYYDNAFVLLKDVEINGENSGNLNLTINISDDLEIEEGDIFNFKAKIENVKLFELGTFNSNAYRENAPYKSYVDSSEIEVLGRKISFDEKVRYSIRDSLNKNMGKEYGPVAYAVLFGNKDDVDQTIKDVYKMAGVVHILTVSGLHVSFLIALIGWVLKKCKVRGWLNFLLCAAFLGLYSYLCGFSPSVVRAGIMGLVLLATKLSGKCYDNLNSIAIAGIIILAINPLSALDVGFLMSFFCVLGIFVVSPLLMRLFRKFLPKFIADSFAISISASIGILPAMSTFFGYFNFLSFFSNLIVVPIFSFLYPLLFVFAFLTSIMPFMAFGLKICDFGFKMVYQISAFFAGTSFSVNLWPIAILSAAFLFLALFLASKYCMIGKRLKVICCSALLILSTTYTFVDNMVKPEPGIAYCVNRSYSIIMMTNSEGKSVVVDLSGEVKKVMSICKVNEISTFFFLDTKIRDVTSMRQVGMQNIVSCNNTRNYDEEVLVDENVKYKLDGFEFEYKAIDGLLCGLEIGFDDVSAILISNNISNQNILKLSESYYDFVLLGFNDEAAKYFSAASVVLAYEKAENVDRNYLQDGNSFYKIKENKFVWRCLD